MDKAYRLSEALTQKQIQTLNQDLMQSPANPRKYRKTLRAFTLVITPQWRLVLNRGVVELHTKEPLFHGCRIVANDTSITTIDRIDVPGLQPVTSQVSEQKPIGKIEDKSSVFLKTVEFINAFIKKKQFYGQKRAKVDLGQLGFLKFQEQRIQYYNKQDDLIWTASKTHFENKIKLDQLFENKFKLCTRKNIKMKDNKSNEKIARKFSLSSFKTYSQQKSAAKHIDHVQQSQISKKRVNSLPSLFTQQTKVLHKQTVQKMQDLKAFNQEKPAHKEPYLKIQRPSSRKLINKQSKPASADKSTRKMSQLSNKQTDKLVALKEPHHIVTPPKRISRQRSSSKNDRSFSQIEGTLSSKHKLTLASQRGKLSIERSQSRFLPFREAEMLQDYSQKKIVSNSNDERFQVQAVIARLISSKIPTSYQTQSLIIQLSELYQQRRNVAPQAKKTKKQGLIFKNPEANTTKPHRELLQSLNRHLFQKHQPNKLVIQLISQLLSSFQGRLDKKPLYLDSNKSSIEPRLRLLAQLIQEHQFRLNQFINQHVTGIFEKQHHEKSSKQKFHRYRFDHSYQKKPVAPWQSNPRGDQADKEFRSEQENQLQGIVDRYDTSRREVLVSYFLQSYSMPYYYVLAERMTALFLGVFRVLDKDNTLKRIELDQITEIKSTICKYVQRLENLYETFMLIFKKIPEKNFNLQAYQTQEVRNIIQRKKNHVKQCEQFWLEQLKQKYLCYQTGLHKINAQIQRIKQDFRKNPQEQHVKQRDATIKLLEGKMQKIIGLKTFLQRENLILDVSPAKLHLLGQYETTLCNFYESTYEVLTAVHVSWSQEMAKTERMMADQLADDEHQIISRITHIAKNYYTLVAVYFLNRKSLYSEQATGSECIGLNRLQNMEGVEDEESTQRSPTEVIEQTFEKCVANVYNMFRKNAEKAEQIAFVVLRHKEKVQILSKALERREKEIKAEHMQLKNELKKILREIKQKSDILNFSTQIRQLQGRQKLYLEKSSRLNEQMQKNYMIVWQDDQFINLNLNVCMRTIAFMDSELYRKINCQPVDSIRFQHFFKYYKSLEKLMGILQGHQFEELFRNEFDLSQSEFEFIEMALYKDYNIIEIDELNLKDGLDLRPTITTIKIVDLLRLHRNHPQISNNISQIYYRRKHEKYKKNSEKPFKIEIEIEEYGEGELIKIENYDEIRMTLQEEIDSSGISEQHREVRREQLRVCSKLMLIYNMIHDHFAIVQEIDSEIKEQEQVEVLVFLQKLKLHYQNAVKSFKMQKNFTISDIAPNNYRPHSWSELLELAAGLQKFSLVSKFYNYMSQVCNRLVMVPQADLLCLLDWSTPDKIGKNIGIIFPEVVHAEINPSNEIVAVCTRYNKSRDRIEISSGPIATNRHDKYAKLIKHIEKEVHKSGFSLIRNSNGRTCQIKLLHWLLYFTQQVEQSMITNTSLKTLQAAISDTIYSIKNDLRYDIRNHKQEQIGQLNAFIHYLRDSLGQFPFVDSYEWLSTIRAYEKNSCVMVQQNSLEFYYGFEPKTPRVLHAMNWNLGLSVGYGDQSLVESYRFKAYILGVPFVQILDLQQSFLCDSKLIGRFIQVLEVNNYICTISCPSRHQLPQSRRFNQIHQQLMSYYFSKARTASGVVDKDQNRQKNKDLLPQAVLAALADDAQSISSSRTGDNLSSIRGRLGIYMLYPHPQDIPPCLSNIYRCGSRKKLDVNALNLQIHVAVECSKLAPVVKSVLIWKLAKLVRAVNSIKSTSETDLLKLIASTVGIVEKYNCFTKDTKNQIYCQLVQNLLPDYTLASSIVNDIFVVEDFEADDSRGQQSSVQFPRTRKNLLQKIATQYNELTQAQPQQRKPVLIYGREPSCKTTFIADQLQLRLAEPQGYIEATEISMEGYSSDGQKPSAQYSVIEAGSLAEVPPSIIPNYHLLYAQPIQEPLHEQYEAELRDYFHEILINCQCNFQLQKQYVCRMWTLLLVLYRQYEKLQQRTLKMGLSHLIDQVTKVFSRFLLVQKQTKTKSKPLVEQQKDFRTISEQLVQLFLVASYEMLSFSFHNKQMRKIFNQQVRKSFLREKVKAEPKMQQIDTVTYTNTGEIVKYDSLSMVKTIQRKPGNQVMSVMNKEVIHVVRYIESGSNLLIYGSNMCYFTMITKFLQQALMAPSPKTRSSSFKQQNSQIFRVETNMRKFSDSYSKLLIVSDKKKSRLHLSKGTVSTKYMDFSSKSLIPSEERVGRSIYENTLILIDDLHLGSPDSTAQLITHLNRSTNEAFKTYMEEDKVFIMFNCRSGTRDQPLSNRLRRHAIEIVLPEIELATIFKSRAQLMMSEDQANIPLQLLKLGIFGAYEPNLEMQVEQFVTFCISTNVKLPSQLYAKYIAQKLCLKALSACPLQLPDFGHKPQPTIQNIIETLRSSQPLSKIADKLTSRGGSTFFIRRKNEQLQQLQPKSIEVDIKVYISRLPLVKKLLAEIYAPYVWLLYPGRLYIIGHDHYQVLTELYAQSSHQRTRLLSHAYSRQLVSQLQQLILNKESQVVVSIPEYLLHYGQFRKFLLSIVYAKQPFMEDKHLFDFWWECVCEREFIENRYDQYQTIKAELMQALLNRVTFIVTAVEMNCQEVLALILSGESQGHSNDDVLLHPERIKPTKQPANLLRNQDPRVLQQIIILNLQLTHEQQQSLLSQVFHSYTRQLPPQPQLAPHTAQALRFLLAAIAAPSTPTFYLVLQAVPSLLASLYNIQYNQAQQSTISMGSIGDLLRRDSNPDMIYNMICRLRAKIDRLGDSRTSNQGRLQGYEGYYGRLAERLRGLHTDATDPEPQQIDKEGKKMSALERYRLMDKSAFISEKFSELKNAFLELKASEQSNQFTINEATDTNLIQLLQSCLPSQQQLNQQGTDTHDSQSTTTQNHNPSQPTILNYLQCEANFIRIHQIDPNFIDTLCTYTPQQYDQFLLNLQLISSRISNYNSLHTCLRYAYQLCCYVRGYRTQEGYYLFNELIVEPGAIEAELRYIQYINLIETLGICKKVVSDWSVRAQAIRDTEHALHNCIKFLLEVGGYEPDPTDPSTYHKNYDSEIKLAMFQAITGLVLSRTKHNLGLYYHMHRELQLQKHKHILAALDCPAFLHPHKWRQIEDQVLMSGPAKGTGIRTSNIVDLVGAGESRKSVGSISSSVSIGGRGRRVSIDAVAEKAEHSQVGSPMQAIVHSRTGNRSKYVIVHDPHSQMAKFIKSNIASTRNSYRKVCLLRLEREQLSENEQEHQQLWQLNHLLTYYVYYFDLGQYRGNYEKEIGKLNKIVSVLRQKDMQKRGFNDRLIVVVRERFLCEDLASNITILPRQTQQGSRLEQKQAQHRLLQSPEAVAKAYLQMTEIDLLDLFNQQYKSSAQSRKELPQKGQAVSIKLLDSKSDLKSLHTSHTMCKNYLKSLISGLAEEEIEPESEQVSGALVSAMKCLKQYEYLTKQLLGQFCSTKLLDYDFFLATHNLAALAHAHRAVDSMLAQGALPMDFVEDIGQYMTVEMALSKLHKDATRKNKNNVSLDPHGQELYSAGLELMAKLFEQYKLSFYNQIYCVKRDQLQVASNNKISLEKQKILAQIVGGSCSLIMVYDKFESWIARELNEHASKSKVSLIFDSEPNSYQSYLSSITQADKKDKKTIYLVHESHLGRMSAILHCTKVLWI